MKFKDRIKSYGFWTALSASIVLLVQAIGRCFGFQVEEHLVSDIIMSVCGVLVVLGIVVMPKKDNSSESTKNQPKQDSNSTNSETQEEAKIIEAEEETKKE